MNNNKRSVILEAIDSVKKGTFHATGIKLELEAQFNRGRAPRAGNGCSDCDGSGYYTCEHCGGDWEDYSGCSECEGGCDDCTDGYVDCDECTEGRNRCNYCEIPDNSDAPLHNWRSEPYCQDWLFEQLASLKLAEKNTIGKPGWKSNYGMWRPKLPLVFGKFYNDQSVDSEFTFTLSLQNSKDVFLLPKIIEIWNRLGEAIGQGVDLAGAGMHTAWLNDPDCYYSRQQKASDKQYNQFRNFQRSMSLMMPALFFLASPDEKSRPLKFREPVVGCPELGGNKYSAVAYRSKALEFRVFNVCYDNPEQILDNIVVMKNCMRYWTNKYRPSGLGKIVQETSFGHDMDDSLKRFYCTADHIDLLNAGLKRLKPAYYSVKQIKSQRKFDVDKKTLKKLVSQNIEHAKLQYREYEERFAWKLATRRRRFEADVIDQRIANARDVMALDRSQLMMEVENEVDQYVSETANAKVQEERFITDKIREIEEQQKGAWRLREAR